jgi:hypothetical protein
MSTNIHVIRERLGMRLGMPGVLFGKCYSLCFGCPLSGTRNTLVWLVSMSIGYMQGRTLRYRIGAADGRTGVCYFETLLDGPKRLISIRKD